MRPDLLQQVVAGLNPAPAPRQHRQQSKLRGRDVDTLATDEDPVAGHIDGQFPKGKEIPFDGRGLLTFEAAPNPQHQLAGTERLDDVVIRAQLEPKHPVHLRPSGGNHDHRDPFRDRVAAKPLADLEPVQIGQHEVEKHQIRPLRPRDLQSLAGCAGTHRFHPGSPQLLHQHLQDIGLVIDHEDLCHGRQPCCGLGSQTCHLGYITVTCSPACTQHA